MKLAVDAPVTVSPDGADVRLMISRHARETDAARSLTARVLLHLPRVADSDGWVSASAAEAEVSRMITEEPRELPSWMEPPPGPPRTARELQLRALDERRARVILDSFHYLRSFRPSSLHLAGFIDDRVCALLSFSPFDLDGGVALPSGVEGHQVLVLSRVYAVPWAPRNSLSRLLALAARELRELAPEARMLLTYLNPNLGFDGASYKASNWVAYGRETGTRYAYLDGWYVTDRELNRLFGTSAERRLRRALGDRIQFSRMDLEPLELYANPLDNGVRRALEDAPMREWPRPWP